MTEQETLKKQREEEQEEQEAIDQMDSQQIKSEIQGRVIEEYAYSFKIGNRTVTGLSYAGVLAVARQQGDITINDLRVEFMRDRVIATCTGTDEKRKITLKAVVTQPTTLNGEPDSFAVQKATAKAQRNVLRRLINEKLYTEMLKDALAELKKHKDDARQFM